ncbi:gamma-aminobutyric acid receptor subunit rho-2-like [Ditylenchus destructor]|nr:gamma-aminobutyric acid receptor subunit rho-2-like [Ditylenchus destructor]
MSTSSFHMYLPSNTRVEGNTTGSFTVQLPKKLEFNSTWVVGLTGIIYPHSWHNLGTESMQYIEVKLKDGSEARMMVPTSMYKNVEELISGLKSTMNEEGKKLCKIKNRVRRQATSTTPKPMTRFQVLLLFRQLHQRDAEMRKIRSQVKEKTDNILQVPRDQRMSLIQERRTLVDNYNNMMTIMEGIEKKLGPYNVTDFTNRQKRYVEHREKAESYQRELETSLTLSGENDAYGAKSPSSSPKTPAKSFTTPSTPTETSSQTTEPVNQSSPRLESSSDAPKSPPPPPIVPTLPTEPVTEMSPPSVIKISSTPTDNQSEVVELVEQVYDTKGKNMEKECEEIENEVFDRIAEYVVFSYEKMSDRFSVLLNKNVIESIKLSAQLRFLLPIGKTIAQELGKEALNTSGRVLMDIASGQPVKQTLLDQTRGGLKHVIDNVYMKAQKGSGKRRRSIKGVEKMKWQGRVAKKGPKRRIDYLGPY